MDRPNTVTTLATGLIRIIAPNPSKMTYWGTNTYILGNGAERVLVDPGPDDLDHLRRCLEALPQHARISHILVTHAHKDHSAGAQRLSDLCSAPTYAFGDSLAGRMQIMIDLAASGLVAGGEGVDLDFTPDHLLHDSEVLQTPAGPITALHTPGHMGNHLCFAWNGHILTGDLIMGWSSSLISPPDGDAAAFRESCKKLLKRSDLSLLPAHGAPVPDGASRITALLKHRAHRENQIIEALANGPLDLPQLTERVYGAVDSFTFQAAQRNTFAHLIDLAQQSRVTAHPHLHETAEFRAVLKKVKEN
ncbi:glyoxylase-like metal-dependent hydrolase (beta-lactamase superfamily II) [Pacificibacter maritimus]|uniref:Glyoxylase-like metal-dependent hydrolase (Beta-lactamase superfamily II) n=1 Tax=Pacificibacter maritimus TaxID=762213 RepID=A0A3N4ULS9_9RHOB|nr:MBL fold metallo-hydrolase [Pacificibacter maritimus]RPE71586.1 glyoxylase-like metal-dependent hydrolase (beta-lactamase superfamily II) [Pacificibacter maritimus]